MKKLIVILLPIMVLSCSDLLDLNVDPKDRIPSTVVLKNETLIRANLTDLYDNFPDFAYDNMNWNYSDEATNRNGNSNAVTRGQVSRTNDIPGFFDYSYIRQINEFIENVSIASIGDVAKTQMIAEARVIRAIVYFEMQKRYGGVPLRSEERRVGKEGRAVWDREQ